MIAEWGLISLALALLFAFLQSVLPLLGYRFANPYLIALARPSAIGQFCFVVLAYIFLTIAFAVNDFSIAYVADNSSTLLPFMYKLTAVWGAHEGSILLWILLVNVWTMAFIIFQKKNPSLSLVVALLGIINFSFLCFLIFTSNPFVLSLGEQTGRDLNPLLQDPGLIIHPPMLYIGYVGFSAAFAITLSSLLRGQLDAKWAYVTRQFAIAAWCFLTFGIALGSWWAYRVLGWGGFWFWDPVENASLLPWIAGTALIHVLLLVEKRGVGNHWAAFLALITFALSLLGTFLVRSGVLISAHTFANDPSRGVFLLILLGILITGSLLIYFLRISHSPKSEITFSFLSRETGLMFNSGLLFVAMLTILLGTLYPLILDALHLGTISVGAPYFNFVMMPLVLIAMTTMGFATMCPWQKISWKELWRESVTKIIVAFISAGALLYGVTGEFSLLALFSLFLSFWIILNVRKSLFTYKAMSIAHTGFALLIIGILLSSLLSTEREVRMNPGSMTQLGPYQFFFVDTQGADGENYRGIRAIFDVIKNKRHITTLYPEKRIYTVRQMVMTKVDIHPGIFRDLYIALGDPLDQNHWSLRIYYKPFIRFIWFGALLMMIGGFCAIFSRKNYGVK